MNRQSGLLGTLINQISPQKIFFGVAQPASFRLAADIPKGEWSAGVLPEWVAEEGKFRVSKLRCAFKQDSLVNTVRLKERQQLE